MQPLEAFMPRLMTSATTCPVPTAHQALVDAAAHFCTETDVVNVNTYPVPVRASVSVYDLDLPQGQDPVRVVSAWLDGQRLAVRVDTEPGSGMSGDESAQPRGTPHSVTFVGQGQVKLYPTPDADGAALTFRIATRPSPAATRLHEDLYFRWRDAVVAGAQMRLAAIPGQAFTDPRVEARATAVFWREVNRARIESRRNHTGATARVQARPFA